MLSVNTRFSFAIIVGLAMVQPIFADADLQSILPMKEYMFAADKVGTAGVAIGIGRAAGALEACGESEKASVLRKEIMKYAIAGLHVTFKDSGLDDEELKVARGIYMAKIVGAAEGSDNATEALLKDMSPKERQPFCKIGLDGYQNALEMQKLENTWNAGKN